MKCIEIDSSIDMDKLNLFYIRFEGSNSFISIQNILKKLLWETLRYFSFWTIITSKNCSEKIHK